MAKDSLDTTIDFSVLGTMEIPEISQGPKLKVPNKTEQEEIKLDLITQVDSLEDFVKETNKKSEDTETEIEVPTEDEELEVTTPEASKGTEEQFSPVKGIALWAKEQGLVDFEEDKFEDNEDWLKTTFEGKIKQLAQEEVNQYKEQFPAVLKELADKFEEGVPLDELIYSKSREIEYNGISEKALEEDKELQKSIISDWYTNSEYTPEEIKTKLQKLEDAVLLEDEAKTALNKLKVFEKRYQEQLVHQAEANKKAQEKEFQEKLKSIEQKVLSSEEIIPGVKLSVDDRKRLYNAYTKTDSKKETELIKALKKDPDAWLKITQFMVLMNGNLDSVKSSIKTETTKKLKETVNTYQEDKNSLSKIDFSKIKKAIALDKKRNKL